MSFVIPHYDPWIPSETLSNDRGSHGDSGQWARRSWQAWQPQQLLFCNLQDLRYPAQFDTPPAPTTWRMVNGSKPSFAIGIEALRGVIVARSWR
jgi:hypothetical protein